jgi:uncharacterized membrane protein YfcA
MIDHGWSAIGAAVGQVGDGRALLLIFAGALAGGVVNGITGFGYALTGLPFWLQAVEPLIAAHLACACSVMGHISTFPTIWRSVEWGRHLPMLAAGVAGVPIGILVLPLISLGTFKLGVGLLLAAYCSFMLLAAGRIGIAAGGRGAETAIGFAGGVLGGLAGLSGVLPTVWATLKSWPKDQRRAFFQAFNFTVLTAMLAMSAVSGLVGVGSVVAILVAVPATLIGTWLGLRLYKSLDDLRFDRIVLVVLLLSGLALVWSSL